MLKRVVLENRHIYLIYSFVWWMVLPIIAGCSSEGIPPLNSGSPSDAGPDVETPDAGMPDAGGISCPVGHAPGLDGKCEPVGIQGCTQRFVDPDGVCRPSMAKCADMPGTIPKFDEGCIPVGITNCAPEFIEDDGLCHPRMQKCAGKPGTFAVPQLGCVPIDGPLGCGPGTWGNIVDEPGTVYVDGSYIGGSSDGGQAQPYTTISEAIANVQAGGKVAVAAGVYDEAVSIQKPLILEGRCPSMVSLAHTGASETLTIANTTGAKIRGLRIGGLHGGIKLQDTVDAKLEHTHLQNAHTFGIFSRGATTTLTIISSLIEGSQPETVTGPGGWGIDFAEGTLSISHSAIIANHYAGVHLAAAGTQGELIDSLLEGNLPAADSNLGGYGILTYAGAYSTLISTAVVENHTAGAAFFEGGASGDISESLIEKNLPAPDDLGNGIYANTNAIVSAHRNAILANTTSGIFGFNSGVLMLTSENLIAQTVASPNNSRKGIGLEVQHGAKATMMGDAIFRNQSTGLWVFYSDSSIEATRVLVEQTLPSPKTGKDGTGMVSFLASGLNTLHSCAFINNSVSAVGIVLGQATITNSLLSQTQPGSFLDSDGSIHLEYGDGFDAALNSDAILTNTILERNARAGIIYDESGGSIHGCESRENSVGVAIQRMPRPMFALDQNSIKNNKAADFLADGALEIPKGF